MSWKDRVVDIFSEANERASELSQQFSSLPLSIQARIIVIIAGWLGISLGSFAFTLFGGLVTLVIGYPIAIAWAYSQID